MYRFGNGCAHCIDLHSRDLVKEGMSVDELVLAPVWHEAASLFSDQERAALAWAEEVTRVSENHVSDAACAAASSAFNARDLADLTIAIAAMNAFNRMGVSFRLKPAASRQGVSPGLVRVALLCRKNVTRTCLCRQRPENGMPSAVCHTPVITRPDDDQK